MSCRLPRPKLSVIPLEDRAVPAGLDGFGGLPPAKSVAADVYVETNNPAPGQNAVIGYHRSPVDGHLTRFGTFLTGGTGQLNVPKTVGPDDGDQEVVATPDGRFLFAVNQGSDTIAAFRIRGNGRLDLIGTVPSGGDQPDSIGLAGNFLYVANRGDAGQGHPGTVAPNVTGFNLGRDGTLTAIPNSTVTFPVGTFVTQTLITPGGRFLFAEAATLAGTPGGNTVNPFQVRPDGSLVPAPGGPAAAGANPSVLLGAAVHPTRNIVYAGLTAAGQVGVFTYDETGRTSFVGSAADAGRAPCWLTVSADGRVLYAANTATDSIGVFSLADPLHPVQIQDLPLGGPRTLNGDPGSPVANAFEIALDPTGRFLFAVTQATDPSFPQGNQLHTLAVARDGTLTEPTGPVVFTTDEVGANAHPQGIAVVSAGGGGGHHFPDHFFDRLETWAGDR